jgi:hypothetical protein
MLVKYRGETKRTRLKERKERKDALALPGTHLQPWPHSPNGQDVPRTQFPSQPPLREFVNDFVGQSISVASFVVENSTIPLFPEHPPSDKCQGKPPNDIYFNLTRTAGALHFSLIEEENFTSLR